MSAESVTEIAIVGGGVIGLATALRLSADGREVAIVEPNEPGSGASYGNAGTIADYGIIPVGTPSVLRNLPSLLFDPDSPLSIRRSAALALLPWLVRFGFQSLPGNARRNAATLAGLLAGSLAGWRDLASEAGASDLLKHNGCLYLYNSPSQQAADRFGAETRRRHDIAQEFLSAEEVAHLEPRLPPFEGGGVLFPDAVNLTDPGEMMRRLTAAARAAGVQFVKTRANRLERMSGGVCIHTSSGSLMARRAVIAAGAHSRMLAAQAGDRIPLDTERGYHVEFDMPSPLLSRPVCPTSRGFYLVPMAGRLRVAGTVELGGLTAPANPRRIALLETGARSLLPSLAAADRSWLGFRPSIPDSIPVIGPSVAGYDIILAFGHGHLGLTLAPVTAGIVGDIVAGRSPAAAAAGCSPARFG